MSMQIEKLRQYLYAAQVPQPDEVIRCFRPGSFARNTVLHRAGEICNTLYFIEKGCIRIYYITEQGHEKTRHIAAEGAFITALSGFITQRPAFEFVETTEASEVYMIGHADFYRLVDTVPAWEKLYRSWLEQAYISQQEKIESLVTLSAGERYEQLRKANPQYMERLSSKTLASYLDITQETLSRLKSKRLF